MGYADDPKTHVQQGTYFPHQLPGISHDPDSLEVTLPFLDKNRYAGVHLPSAAKYKPSSNDKAGNFGLKRAGPTFSSVDRAYSGWATGLEAADAFNLVNQTGKDAESKTQAQMDVELVNDLRKANKQKLKQLSMDVLFNGTFWAKGAEINWSAEGKCLLPCRD